MHVGENSLLPRWARTPTSKHCLGREGEKGTTAPDRTLPEGLPKKPVGCAHCGRFLRCVQPALRCTHRLLDQAIPTAEFKFSDARTDNAYVEGAKTETRRSKAGASALRRHRRNMMPWSYVLLGVLLAALVVEVLFLAGFMPLWAAVSCIPAMLVTYLVWDKKTGKTDATWGEGARGEKRVGAELERLHEEGFHVFHDWDKGKGNVDHFLVGPQGVFAVETKAWTGEIAAEGNRLKRDGKFVPDNRPVKQAMSNAFAVRKLIRESHGEQPFVVPILCFSKATVSCYAPVGGVEIANLGSLNRVIMHARRRRYSPAQVQEFSRAPEEHLGTSPAVKPGLPPEEPTRTKKLVDSVFSLPDSTTFLGIVAVVFLVSLALPAQASKVFLGIAYLYHLLGEAWESLF